MEKHPNFLHLPPLSTNYYLSLFLVFLSYSFSSCNKIDPSFRSASEENTLTKPFFNPEITYISDLPDSLQPPTFHLSEMSKPRVIPFPVKKGTTYERINIAGERQIVELEPPQVYPLPVLVDEDGNIKLNDQGLPFLIGKGGRGLFKNFTSEDGLAADAVRSLVIDSRGDLWIGTYGGGVSRFDGLEFKNFTVDHGLPNHRLTKEANGELFFEIRIGIHTGPVVAGIVGIKKFQYDIWGDTVNTASRMESSGETGKVNISGTTYKEVKEFFKCSHRGKIAAKGKGEIDMYFVERNDQNLNK